MNRTHSLTAVMVAAAMVAGGSTASGAQFVWDGAPDGGGASANNNTLTATNWLNDIGPGDNSGNDHLYTGTPALTTINYGPGATTLNDVAFLTFDSLLATDLSFTGSVRGNANPMFVQNSARNIVLGFTTFANLPGFAGSGTGTVTVSGTLSRGQGADAGAFTINNAAYPVVWSGSISAGNDWWRITKQGAGTLTVSGTWNMIDTLDYGPTNSFVDVTAGTFEVTGTVNGGNVRVNSGTFTGGSGGGVLGYYIDGADSDLIDFNSGTLDLSTLTINFLPLAGGVTEDQYVLVDYAGANLGGSDILTLSSNSATDQTFFSATNLPSGYTFFHDEPNKQILLVLIPEPASLALLGLVGMVLLPRRRR